MVAPLTDDLRQLSLAQEENPSWHFVDSDLISGVSPRTGGRLAGGGPITMDVRYTLGLFEGE